MPKLGLAKNQANTFSPTPGWLFDPIFEESAIR
jgi:hypothetical protein